MNNRKSNFDINYLKERLHYNAETGELIWKHHDSMSKSWNSKWRDKEALRSIDTRGYKSGKINGVQTLCHRVVWAIVNGKWPSGDIDHIDGNKKNNRIENLRPATNTQNQWNRRGIRTAGWTARRKHA